MKIVREINLKIGKTYRYPEDPGRRYEFHRHENNNLYFYDIIHGIRGRPNSFIPHSPTRIWHYFNEDQENQFKFGK